jgi:2-keto-4-pentenoate hydratase/2-oxohepta-3-ene-1,7-dioic acid hydratase in catechol pathway
MIPDFLKNPSKIVAVGLNYRSHAKELDLEIPKVPMLFIKPTTSIISCGEEIVIPEMSNRVDYEGELAIVIKDRTKDVSLEEAKDHVLGFTCLNDVTARDIQKEDGQWTRAKSFDSFCPIGPILVGVDDIDPNNLKLVTRLNGKVVQESSTSDFVFDVWEVVSFISKVMTLIPYDVITTGTPSGIGPMKSGDIVEVEIEGIGILKNKVK